MSKKILGIVVLAVLLMAWGSWGLLAGAQEALPEGAPDTAFMLTDSAAAGDELAMRDATVENVKAVLGGWWRWDGNVGTLYDGVTQIQLTGYDGMVGVDVLTNGTIVSDECVAAQVLYGTHYTDPETVNGICDNQWGPPEATD